eukprot:FR735203.1.p1 GENE.FR735203.1~~FR735203.1.p1  ORF type:complete len:115 (+),score=9.27 FR735203.1:370-714(+)
MKRGAEDGQAQRTGNKCICFVSCDICRIVDGAQGRERADKEVICVGKCDGVGVESCGAHKASKVNPCRVTSGTPEVICVIFVKRVREGRAEKTMVYVESPMICVAGDVVMKDMY